METTQESIEQWLVTQVATALEFAPSEVQVGLPLSRYGLDSIAAAGLADDLGRWLGAPVDQSLDLQRLSIRELAQRLAR